MLVDSVNKDTTTLRTSKRTSVPYTSRHNPLACRLDSTGGRTQSRTRWRIFEELHPPINRSYKKDRFQSQRDGTARHAKHGSESQVALAILSRLMKHEKEHSLQEKVAVLKQSPPRRDSYGKNSFERIQEGLLVGNITELWRRTSDSLKQLLVNAAANF